MKDLRSRAIRGGAARLIGQGGGLFLRLAMIVALSRLISPEQFGIVAMVTVVTGLCEVFSSAGLSTATIQAPQITRAQLSQMYWINLAVSGGLGLSVMLAGPLMAAFYGEPRLIGVAIVAGLTFVVGGLGVQQSAILQREMRYVTLSIIEVAGLATNATVSVLLALQGAGYWALVYGVLASTVVVTAAMWNATRFVPDLPRRGVHVGALLRMGVTVSLNSFVIYVAYNAEKMLLGRFWGPTALGLYGRAYQLINVPTATINGAVYGIALSALSRLHDDPERFKSYFLKGYALVVSLTVPVTIMCALFAEDIVRIMLGPHWSSAAMIFRLLAPTVFVFGLINPLAPLILARGLQRRSLETAVAIAGILLVAVIIGLPYGPAGVATAYSAAMMLWAIPHTAWSLHGTGITLRDVGGAIIRPLIAGAVGAMSGYVVLRAVTKIELGGSDLQAGFIHLVIGGAVMMAAYMCTLLYALGQRQFYLDTVRGLLARRDEQTAG